MQPEVHPSFLRIAEEGGSTAVSFPAGTTLTEANAEEFAAYVASLYEANPTRTVSLELSGVAMLSSIALAKLISLNGKARKAGGRLTLVNPNPPVRQVFKLTKLDTILEIRSAPDAIPA